LVCYKHTTGYGVDIEKVEMKKLNTEIYFECPVTKSGKSVGVLLGYITKDQKYYNMLWIRALKIIGKSK
jgi:hypothetical protein